MGRRSVGTLVGLGHRHAVFFGSDRAFHKIGFGDVLLPPRFGSSTRAFCFGRTAARGASFGQFCLAMRLRLSSLVVLRSTFLRERHVVIPRDPAVTALDSAAGRRIRNGVLIREALDQVLERNDG